MQKRLMMTALAGTLVMGLAACGGGEKSGPPTSLQPTFVINGAAVRVGSGSASNSQASGSDLSTSADSFSKVKSYRATYLLETQGAPSQEGKMEIVAPDKSHMSFGTFEVIKIGTDTYFKVGATWTKTAAAGSNTPSFDVDSVTRNVSNLKSSGAIKGATASVNGKTCQIYSFTSSAATSVPGAPASSYEACIADGLPLRVISQSGGSKTTITFSDYNANIEIKAPI